MLEFGSRNPGVGGCGIGIPQIETRMRNSQVGTRKLEVGSWNSKVVLKDFRLLTFEFCFLTVN